MEENITASTDANLDSLARFCNEFFETNSLQFTIKDLAWWLSGKANPHYFPDADRRKGKVSDGMVNVIKGFLKLYRVGPTGRMVFENQFTPGLWIRTTWKQLSRCFGLLVSKAQYRLCRKMLKLAGILKVKVWRNKKWGSKTEIQFDIARLKEIIDELPKLKKITPSRDNWPLPQRRDLEVTSPIVLVENASSISPVEPTTSLDEGRTIGASGEKETSHVVGDSLLQEKPIIDFANEEFRGTLDTEGELILGLIRQTFDDTITCGLIRKLNYLRRRNSRIALTLQRIAKYFEYRSEHVSWPILPEWMVKLPLEKLLAPGIWVSVVASIDRHAHDSAVEDADFLKMVAEFELAAVQSADQVFNRPDEFWQKMIIDVKHEGSPWLCYALYGWRKGWSDLMMGPIRAKAKAMLSDMPVFFTRTEHIIGWSRLLGLTEKEAAEIRQKGDNKLRAAQWRVYLAQQAGAI